MNNKILFCFSIFLLASANINAQSENYAKFYNKGNKLLENNKAAKGGAVYRLAKDIIYNQEREILFMKNML